VVFVRRKLPYFVSTVASTILKFFFFLFFLEKIELFVIPVSDLESSFYSEWKYMSAFLNCIMEVKCLKFCDIGVNVKLGLLQ
jgi:hypothetical protein